MKPFGDDSAEQYEATLKPIFYRGGLAVRRLHEATSPGGDAADTSDQGEVNISSAI